MSLFNQFVDVNGVARKLPDVMFPMPVTTRRPSGLNTEL